MNPDGAHYRATKAHLRRFEKAVSNIEDRPGKRTGLDCSNSTRSTLVPRTSERNWVAPTRNARTMERYSTQAIDTTLSDERGRAVMYQICTNTPVNNGDQRGATGSRKCSLNWANTA